MAQLIGTTNRQIVLTNAEAPARFGPQVKVIPAGTQVEVTPLRRGLRIRLAHTLYTQDVDVDDIQVP